MPRKTTIARKRHDPQAQQTMPRKATCLSRQQQRLTSQLHASQDNYGSQANFVPRKTTSGSQAISMPRKANRLANPRRRIFTGRNPPMPNNPRKDPTNGLTVPLSSPKHTVFSRCTQDCPRLYSLKEGCSRYPGVHSDLCR